MEEYKLDTFSSLGSATGEVINQERHRTSKFEEPQPIST